MKKLLRVLATSMTMLALFSTSLLAVVIVEAEIQDIRETGVCHPFEDTIDALGSCGFLEVTLPIQDPNETLLSCTAGPDGQNGTADDICVSLPLMLDNPNGEVSDKTVTTFRFNDSSHEAVGTLMFNAMHGSDDYYANLGEGVNSICETRNFNNPALPPSYASRSESGVFASYDWDVPDRLFSCSDNTRNVSVRGGIACPLDPTGANGCCDLNYMNGALQPAIFGLDTPFGMSGSCFLEQYPLYDTGPCAETICVVAPDETGRLDSKSCSNYHQPDQPNESGPQGPGTYACKLDGTDAEASGFTFFNYLACQPDIDCFDTDPINNAGCDNGGDGPFGGANYPAPNDIWVAGTIMGMRLPFGVRLANTIYPGVMLNGRNQFDYSDMIGSMRMWPLGQTVVQNWDPITGAIIPTGIVAAPYAWPAVVYDFEANHYLTPTVPSDEVCDNVPQQQGPCCGWDGGGSAELGDGGMEFPDWAPWDNQGAGQEPDFSPGYTYNFGPRCRSRFGDFDRIKIFVPDILMGTWTTNNLPSSFQIGESLVNQGGLIPAARGLVSNCYVDSPIAACNQLPPTVNSRCDYDTTICIDIRGAVPAMRHDSSFSYSRHVSFDLELPNQSFTDFSDQQPTVAVLSPSDPTSVWDPFVSAPLSYPNCEGFTFCFVTDVDDDDSIDEYPGTGDDDPGYLYISQDYVSTITIRETEEGFIRVDPAAGATTISCVIPDDDSNGNDLASVVDFVDVDCAIPQRIHAGTRWQRDDCCIVDTPASLAFGGTLEAEVTDGLGMDLELYPWDQSYDEIVITVTRESTDAAEISLSGIQLLVEEDNVVFPGGNGCIEVDCTLYFPGDECRNHEGTLTNGDEDGDIHFPEGGGSFTTRGLRISCIVPGRTVLLFPYLVRMLDADVNVWHDSGVAIVNTMPAWALTHFYLYEEGPAEDGFIRDEPWNMNSGYHNEATNPPIDLLKLADPELLIRGISPEYTWYNEISPLGQYVNLVFEVEDDPYTGVPLNSILAAGDLEGDSCSGGVSRHSSGIFPYEVLQSLSSDPDCNPLSVGGRTWMYAVVQQCYSHGYQIVFSDYGFGSTLALVDQDTEITPINDEGFITLRTGPKGEAPSAVAFIPVHSPPSRWISPIDVERKQYRFWNGNDE